MNRQLSSPRCNRTTAKYSSVRTEWFNLLIFLLEELLNRIKNVIDQAGVLLNIAADFVQLVPLHLIIDVAAFHNDTAQFNEPFQRPKL